MNASDILTAAADTLDQRGKDYDQPEGERSMGRIVDTFNALTGHEMTEAEGWQFMAVLKLVRMGSASDPTDSAVDCAAYAALAGEALGGVGQAPETDGWIKWEGGECPFDAQDRVEIMTREGVKVWITAWSLGWEHRGRLSDIVAYRVCKPEAPASEEATDADGWIPWKGGECPVDEDADVEIRLSDGTEAVEMAGLLRWDETGEPYDIVAYRLAEQEATAQKPEPTVPGKGEKYFSVGLSASEVMEGPWMGDYIDRQRAAFGNCYRTHKEAEAKRAEILGGK